MPTCEPAPCGAERLEKLQALKAAWDRLRLLPLGPERIQARWAVFEALDAYDAACEAERVEAERREASRAG